MEVSKWASSKYASGQVASNLQTCKPANLIITGFMGVGKSEVGQEVARRLGWEFVDMDALIEERLGMTINDIFATYGEGFFRQQERLLCRELGERHGLVIATGGGALIPEENRRTLGAGAMLICLTCEVDEILRRLSEAEDRPLLDLADRRAQIEALLTKRRWAYGRIPHQIDTTNLTIEEVAKRVIALYKREAKKMPVWTPLGGYEILLGEGLLAYVGEELRQLGLKSRLAVVVTDATVGELYGDVVWRSLQKVGFSPLLVEIPEGEAFKTLETVNSLYERFIEGGLDRSGVVLALGGGVIGDTAGFAAATYMRGVPLVHLPTTLVAMVDSSIGGKVGVDHPRAKNLIGAFYQPRLIVADLTALNTLPDVEFRCGLAEVVKAGVIGSPALFAHLEKVANSLPWQVVSPCESSPHKRPKTLNARRGEDSQPQAHKGLNRKAGRQLATTSAQRTYTQGGERVCKEGPAPLSWAIEEAIAVKVRIVEEDPFEQGRRAVLNLGHTFGHAFEALSHYTLRHGEAVSMGLVVAARVAVELGLCQEAVERSLVSLLTGLGLPVAWEGFEPEQVWEAMALDKKKRGKALRFVLPKDIGEVIVTDQVPKRFVLKALEETRGEKQNPCHSRTEP